jgi:phospholipase/carboxylesterase
MKHIFQQGSDPAAPTWVLFDGTGGTERDLLPIAGQINPSASVLSVRGNVLEGGMPRFFRRIAEGLIYGIGVWYIVAMRR